MNFKDVLKGAASIGEGFASFNLFPPARRPSYLRPKSAQENAQQDADAIRRDWEAVGNDLRAAMGKIEAQHPRARTRS